MDQAKDYLWLHLRELPYFRALLRAVEARFYEDIKLPSPTLDLGCGDGHFASIAFSRKIEVGVDPWWAPIKEAHRRGAYLGLCNADGAKLPFPSEHFASVISNSVLEHIPHLDEVLRETNRVLQAEGFFVFCVPNHRFLDELSLGKFLNRLGLRGLGDLYREFFNRISRHHHCDSPVVWENRLQAAGFHILDWWHYFPPNALRTLEWGHYFGLPSLLSKWLVGRWILVPSAWNLALTRNLVQRHYLAEAKDEDGVYTFYIAQKAK